LCIVKANAGTKGNCIQRHFIRELKVIFAVRLVIGTQSECKIVGNDITKGLGFILDLITKFEKK